MGSPAVVFAALSRLTSAFRQSGVPKYNLAQILVKPQPLDPHRLYLSVYPTRQHSSSGGETGPVGQIGPPWQHLNVGRLAFRHGYSQSVLPALRAKFASAIHGKSIPIWRNGSYSIRPVKTDCLSASASMESLSGESSFTRNRQPMELATEADEGRVFHRLPADPNGSFRNFSGKNSSRKSRMSWRAKLRQCISCRSRWRWQP